MLPIVCLCAAAPPAEAEPGPYGVMGDVGLPDGYAEANELLRDA